MGEEPRFGFGQYKGERFSVIAEEEPGFFFWAKGERRPGHALKAYILWIEEHYVVGDRVVTRRSDVTRSSRRAPTPTKAKGVRTRARSKLQVARESGAWEVVEPCVPSCRIEDCSLLGSSGEWEGKTCFKCGTTTKDPRPEEIPCYSPEECPHDVVDNRGSTKRTHWVWCKQCQTCIHQEPQAGYQARTRKAKEFAERSW